MALSGLIASGTSIAGYAGLLLGGFTIWHSIANSSLKVDCYWNQYHRVLLGGHTILSGIANSSPRVDCFRNLYRRVRSVTPRWAYNLHAVPNNPLKVDTSITGYVELLPGGRTILYGIARVDCLRIQYCRLRRTTQ